LGEGGGKWGERGGRERDSRDSGCGSETDAASARVSICSRIVRVGYDIARMHERLGSVRALVGYAQYAHMPERQPAHVPLEYPCPRMCPRDSPRPLTAVVAAHRSRSPKAHYPPAVNDNIHDAKI
jgi:hypothetical protein